MKDLNTLYSGIKKILNQPKQRSVYAVTTGTYIGEFFVYIETTDNKHYFLSLPDMIVRCINQDDFESAEDNKVLDRVEKIPSNVFKICIEQYKKLKPV